MGSNYDVCAPISYDPQRVSSANGQVPLIHLHVVLARAYTGSSPLDMSKVMFTQILTITQK